jgi:RHH-type proline utilization regulon transcriptional repressor/proline dehydrogenase/delta 1-pyrroline-5-carboxylate dehydrogenase
MFASSLETLTQRYGRDLFARLDGDRPILGTPRWVDEQLMGVSMDQEALKIQLFRFVDVLPTLRTTDQINRHLHEYFQQAERDLPLPARWGLKLLPRNGLLGQALAGAARAGAARMARRFIAGSDVAEALATIAKLRRRSMTFTVDLLGEAILTEAEALHYQQSNLDLLDGLARTINGWSEVDQVDRDEAGPLPRVNVSTVKSIRSTPAARARP